MITLDLLQANETGLDVIIRIARALDRMVAAISVRVASKREAILIERAKRSLALLEQAVRAAEPFDLAHEGWKKIHPLMRTACNHMVQEVPTELSRNLLKQCGDLVNKFLEAARILLEVAPRNLKDLAAAAGVLDSLGGSLASSIGSRWDNFQPRLKQVIATNAAGVIIARLADAEAELAKPSGMNHVVLLARLSDVAVLWISPDASLVTRLQGILATIRRRVTEAFDKAQALGRSVLTEQMWTFAKDFDECCLAFQTAEAMLPLVQELHQKRATLSLAALLASAKGGSTARVQDLLTAGRDTAVRVKGVARESLDEPAEDVRWKFKTRGGFKDYTAEKSAEVETKYQQWIAKGRPTAGPERRCEISIQVEGSSRKSTMKTVAPTSGATTRREKCKFGTSCYRKNPDHRKELAHPGDPDWDEPETNPMAEMEKPESKTEKYSLDFHLMTQVNLTRTAAMRSIRRMEAGTVAQQLTNEYFLQVMEYVKDAEVIISKAEQELQQVEETKRAEMQREVDELVEEMKPVLTKFLEIAVLVANTKVVEETVALLGAHADRLGVEETLKERRMENTLEELSQAYKAPEPERRTRCWAAVRRLVRWQALGPNLLKLRLASIQTKLERQTLQRRRAQMRCQALLSEYSTDSDLCNRFRSVAQQVLSKVLRVWSPDPEVVQSILRCASTLQCSMEELTSVASSFTRTMLASALSSSNGISYLGEVLDSANEIAKLARRPLDQLCAMDDLVPLSVSKTLLAVAPSWQKGATSGTKSHGMLASVALAAEIHSKLKQQSKTLPVSFDRELWQQLKPLYDDAEGRSSLLNQGVIIEWAIALSERLGSKLPPWLMNKDQVEALGKLEAAMSTRQEKDLKEAVIFAKQADYSSNPKLTQAYQAALEVLRKLKRLPSGWEVTELVGDDAAGKMFKKIDVASDDLKRLVQKLFDVTKDPIVTRDRRGAVPTSYTVQKIVAVMNADSWSAYFKRQEAVTDKCQFFPGAAPVPDEKWAAWTGAVLTAGHGEAILAASRQPPLEVSANEYLMFHGTKPDAADLIAQNHFDMAFACKSGLFGAGLYFAESCSKSDEYVQANSQGHYPMILCRVTLGHINYCDWEAPSERRKELEDSCLSGAYHCVLGDRKKVRNTFREFIVYDHYQVYPAFIVWYSRS